MKTVGVNANFSNEAEERILSLEKEIASLKEQKDNVPCENNNNSELEKENIDLKKQILELQRGKKLENELLPTQRIIELSEKEWAKFDTLGGAKWLSQRLKFVSLDKKEK